MTVVLWMHQCVCVCLCVRVCMHTCVCMYMLQRRSRARTHITPVMAHVMQDDVIDHLTINPSEVRINIHPYIENATAL